MSNFFLALPCPDPKVDEALDAYPPPESVRRFVAADRHFTVAFLGACSRVQARAAWEVAARGPSVGAFPIRLGLAEPMGTAGSALAVQVTDGKDALEGWMRSVRDPWLAAAGRPKETRPVRAHMTLGRVRRRASDSEREDARSWARSLTLSSIEVRLDRVALYGWSAAREVRLFEILAERAV